MAPPVALATRPPMRLLAPAKINLHLRVGKRRADGFHPLLTWMCTVGLFDTLTLEAVSGTPPATGRAGEPAGAGVWPDLRFDCDQPGLPRDEGNLVVRVAKAFAAEVFAPPPPGGGGLSAGAAGARAPGEGRDHQRRDHTGPAGAARVEALGMGEADRSGPAAAAGETAREAGAARDAGRSVGRGGVTASTDAGTARDGKSYGRDRGSVAPAAPAARVNAPPSTSPLLKIALAKRIPVGAGLGGGSSDAARTLVGLDRLWKAGRAADQLSGFAARFGSDVPFFVAAAFHGPSAACAGRGEVVRPVPPPAPRTALLVLPPFALSTRDVYARFDEMGLGDMRLGADVDGGAAHGPDWHAWSRLAARELLGRLVNDLEPPAFSLRPELAAMRSEVERVVGRTVRMSGSGSSLFTLFDAGEEQEADAAAERVQAATGATAVAVELAPRIGDDLVAAV